MLDPNKSTILVLMISENLIWFMTNCSKNGLGNNNTCTVNISKPLNRRKKWRCDNYDCDIQCLDKN